MKHPAMRRAACLAATVLLAGQAPAHAITPRDEYFRHQWGMAQINATRAWEVTQGNASVVAVIDTGVDPEHPDLPRVLDGADLVDGDADAADENGHGTLIAGIIAATTDARGIAGVAPGARILPVRVLGRDGTGEASDVARGIDLAVDEGAHVINLSLAEVETPAGAGGLLRAPEVDLAIRRAAGRGVTVVVAAGNNHEDGGHAPTAYDASVPGVLVVGASTRRSRPAAYSRYGRGLDLLAPGGGHETDPSDDVCDEQLGIVSTWWDPAERESGYGAACGTSMAVGFVSGVAALLHARGMTNDRIARRITATARDIGARGRDDRSGAGLLDAAAALGVPAPSRRPTPPVRATPTAGRTPVATPTPTVSAAAPLPTTVERVPPLALRVRRDDVPRTRDAALAALLIVLVALAHAVRADPGALRFGSWEPFSPSSGTSSATRSRWRAR